MSQCFERRDVLMEENPAEVEASVVGSSAGPRLIAYCDGDKDDTTKGAMDMLDAEGRRYNECAPYDTSDSEDKVGPPSFAEDSEKEDEDGPDGSTPAVGQRPATRDSATPGPGRSKRNPARKVTWWEKELEA